MNKSGYFEGIEFSAKAMSVPEEAFSVVDVEKAMIILSGLLNGLALAAYQTGGTQGYDPETGEVRRSSVPVPVILLYFTFLRIVSQEVRHLPIFT